MSVVSDWLPGGDWPTGHRIEIQPYLLAVLFNTFQDEVCISCWDPSGRYNHWPIEPSWTIRNVVMQIVCILLGNANFEVSFSLVISSSLDYFMISVP